MYSSAVTELSDVYVPLASPRAVTQEDQAEIHGPLWARLRHCGMKLHCILRLVETPLQGEGTETSLVSERRSSDPQLCLMAVRQAQESSAVPTCGVGFLPLHPTAPAPSCDPTTATIWMPQWGPTSSSSPPQSYCAVPCPLPSDSASF